MRRVQSPRLLRPQTGTWIGGASAPATVSLSEESASIAVLRVSAPLNVNIEGILRQVVWGMTMKVAAAKIRVDVEKCMLLEMTLATRAGGITEAC